MLTQVIMNRKNVPVPVPLKTMAQALTWIEDTLLVADQTITRILLNGVELTDKDLEKNALLKTPLTRQCKLEIQVDSPLDLSIQTLDAMRNLTAVISRNLKPLAVTCWQALPLDVPQELDGVHVDLNLILELIDHFRGLTDAGQVPIENLLCILEDLHQISIGLKMARANSDWKACARILLNRLEPQLDTLTTEAASMQSIAFTIKSTQRPKSLAPSGT